MHIKCSYAVGIDFSHTLYGNVLNMKMDAGDALKDYSSTRKITESNSPALLLSTLPRTPVRANPRIPHPLAPR